MSFTQRGRATAGVVGFSLLMAVLYGPRALNAVVVPGVVALLAAALSVRRIDRPEVERVPPDDGFVGEGRTVTLSLSTGTTFTGRVRDAVPEDLAAAGNDVTTTVGDDAIVYDLDLARRGEHHLGPVTVTVRDVLGLAERTFEYRDEDEVLVYPLVRDLGPRARRELNALPEFRLVTMRGEFDSLREYERGDALRDIHWKSSAKQPDEQLVVKEYVDEDDLGAITVVGESEGGRDAADRMAEATASVAAFLLGAGLTVGVSVPGGVVDPGTGKHQRQNVLELLARTGGGRVPETERNAGDVYVEASEEGSVTVRIEDQLVEFDALVGGDVGGPPAQDQPASEA